MKDFLLVLLAFWGFSAFSQASARDSAEIIRVTDSSLALLSGSPEDEYDWSAFVALYTPSAKLIGVVINPNGDTLTLEFPISTFIEKLAPRYEQMDFHEVATHTEIHIHKNTAHVWQHYKTYGTQAVGHNTGVNSIQLVRIDGRWLIQQILWDNTPDSQ